MGLGDKLGGQSVTIRLASGFGAKGAKGDPKPQMYKPRFVLLLGGFVLSGCVRDVTENDCRSLGTHLRDIWTAEAKYPEKAGSSAEKAVAVIKSEGAKLEESVITTCKKDYLGKPRASGEFSCLSSAKTYAEVQACATIPVH
jgi:hypothetical protein